ncbi:kinase-like protein, partial [Clavulina sp. PMI_390]
MIGKAIRREIISQIQIQHRNVLPILGISSSVDHPLSIVTPFAVNGNAFSYLTRLKPLQRPGVMIKLVSYFQCSDHYIHGMLPPIVHGDIHARNIVIDAEGQGILCDFGLSRIKHENTRSITEIVEGGKLRYLAPELVLLPVNHSYRSTPASDCYAFAMTILELATLQKPFIEYSNEKIASKAARRGVRPQQPPETVFRAMSDSTTTMLWELLEEMWAHEPTERPNMSQVL